MKKILAIIASVFLLLFSFSSSFAQEEKKIYYFYGAGCPHCANVEEYFEKNDIYEKYSIEKREIYEDKENAQLFNEMMKERGVPAFQRGVPTIVMGDKILVGDTPIINNFEEEVGKYLGQESENTNNQEETNTGNSSTPLWVWGGGLLILGVAAAILFGWV